MSVRSSSADVLFIGIDDTDMPGVGGTGSLARRVAERIPASGLGAAAGVTRHQFFEGPGVPKTSRNSAAAIRVEDVSSPGDVFDSVCSMVEGEAIDGSDPGVALIEGGRLPVDAISFGRRAQERLVRQGEARSIARSAGIRLAGLGGTEDGVIGALGAAALRMEGRDGRFVGLPGIRGVAGVIAVGDLLDRTGVAAVVDVDETILERGIMVNVGDWLRPRLMEGRPVVVVRRIDEDWVNADTRPA